MVDREKVIKDLEFCVNGHFKVELSLATKVLALLKEQEAVVRCKDCIFWQRIKLSNGIVRNGTCTNHRQSVCTTTEDWFCADGERKEGR